MYDLETKAPKGKFRVVGTDDFPVPPEEWHKDFDTLEEAKEYIKKYCKPQPMTSYEIWDEYGNEVFYQPPVEAKG